MLRTDDNCPETERWLQITGKSMRWLRNTVRARMATHGPAAHAVLHDELTVKMGGGYDWGCNGMQDMADFFRRSDVQAALHLGKPGVSSFGYESSGPASITLYPELVTKMRVLIYNGDSDACVPCTPHDIAERAQLFQPVSAISLRTDGGLDDASVVLLVMLFDYLWRWWIIRSSDAVVEEVDVLRMDRSAGGGGDIIKLVLSHPTLRITEPGQYCFLRIG